MEQFFLELSAQLIPPPILTLSEWADTYRVLSPEASAEPGKWYTDKTPYLQEIMDAITDPNIETVVLMKSAQTGGSEVILNAIGYYIHNDPCPMLGIQPTLDAAKDFAKDRIATMIRDMPVLAEKVVTGKSKLSENTILHKTFSGGHLTFVGANSEAGLSSRPIRIIFADEVDRYPESAGAGGDPLMLGIKRTTTFITNRKILCVSTPTLKNISRIEKLFNEGTQEHWNYECPNCKEYQPFTWPQMSLDDAKHECKFCRGKFSEMEWKYQTAKWIATTDRPVNSRCRSFHLSEMISPWKRWEKIIEEYYQAVKDGPEMLQVWTNTSLGEPWDDMGGEIDVSYLEARREVYNCVVPKDVLCLTAGIDVQNDRIEVEVVGWGDGKESWVLSTRYSWAAPHAKKFGAL